MGLLAQHRGGQHTVRRVDAGCAARLHGRPPTSRIDVPPTMGLRRQRRPPEARAQR